VLSGDTAPCHALGLASYQADLLVHEATFAAPEIERAAETGHSTAAQAARLAADAEVKLLALTHLSTRYPVGVLVDEARDVFAETIVPRDFDTIEIPFGERGGPELVRFGERQVEEQVQERPEDGAELAHEVEETLVDPS
jgi:ribonuclease Z